VTATIGPGSIPTMYEAPRRTILRFALDVLAGRSRSFARDSREVLDANPYPRRIEGIERVPTDGVFIVVMNHYNRPGLRPYHCAMAVSSALAERRPGSPEIRWAFTSEYRDRGIGPIPIPPALFRWAFSRMARVYDFVALPRRETLMMSRAVALRRLVRHLETAPVGLTPEGLLATDGLVEPPAGNGRLLALLARKGAPLQPVAAWEDGATLVVRFGEPFLPSVRIEGGPEDLDRRVRDEVMVAIGRLLPRRYWGAYDDLILRSGGAPEDR
jgi:1-acyl-sn-glycerol-3-phosphate acyltransferase